jgi:hypothetical protein
LTEKTRWVARSLFAVALCSIPNRASAEKTLANIDGWQVFSDGRAGAFVSYAHGNGIPGPTVVFIPDANGVPQPNEIYSVQGGGFGSVGTQAPATNGMMVYDQGTIDLMRIRSGFVSNQFGFGGRGPVTPYTTASVYVQLWAFVENFDRRKGQPTPPDVRQGWAKLEGPWGSFMAGRVPALFSRGATRIDALYAHRWGVGWPGAIDNNGPTQGQIGFGLLGAGFSGGAIYATPVLAGLQLSAGLFDAVQLQGNGSWTRTRFPRVEAELTFEQQFLNGWGKVALFGNGLHQKVYKSGYCTPTSTFVMETNSYLPCDITVLGGELGGRLELGPFHLGAAGFYGKGTGINYALEVSDAALDKIGNLRATTGAYVQGQVVIRKLDLFAGWGITQVYLTDYDKNYKKSDPRDPRSTDPDPAVQAMADKVLVWSVLKYQMGINAGVIYHVAPNVHLDLDFFRAEAGWWAVNGFAGQTQVVWVGNGGMTVDW